MSEDVADLGLINAAVAGDATALEQLLLSHYGAIERHIEPQIPADARKHFGVEDILQTTFSQAFRDIRRFEQRGGRRVSRLVAHHR